ncbi:hypothetical protein [Candidatus Protofrankia californiensis]|uniref:hypothetical protein n=1 Tax=Candidatus Protofrankia californiensis TaxID=1839754 RepID=UPI0013EA34F4|nr:hypothetical protein [Candidatus Protofrankia californiensis]
MRRFRQLPGAGNPGWTATRRGEHLKVMLAVHPYTFPNFFRSRTRTRVCAAE